MKCKSKGRLQPQADFSHCPSSYLQVRMVALAPKTNTLFCVSFVDRGSLRRIISLRPATRREVKHYVNQS